MRAGADAVPIACVALVVFFLIREHLLRAYRIPSKSMEPTLHGDPVHGDLVLVDKSAWWFRDPEPWDLVTVRAAQAGASHLVKRMVAMGPTELRIAGGDLFARRDGGALQRVCKHPITHRDLRIPVFRHPDPSCEQGLEDFFHLPSGIAVAASDGTVMLGSSGDLPTVRGRLAQAVTAGRAMAPPLPGFIATHKPIDTSYLNPSGRREGVGRSWFADVGLAVRVHIASPPAAFVFVLEHRERVYALAWEQSGRMWSFRRGAAPTELPRAAPMVADRTAELAFGYLDGHLFLTSDDTVLAYFALELDPNEESYLRQNRLQLGLCDGSARIEHITAFHDIPIASDPGRMARNNGVYELGPGEMFLLGDNTHDSADSRSRPPVARRRLIGRPIAILAPRRRRKWLAR